VCQNILFIFISEPNFEDSFSKHYFIIFIILSSFNWEILWCCTFFCI